MASQTDSKTTPARQRSCPICSSSNREVLYRRDFTRLSGGLLNGYTVVSCQDCGFCFADDLPSQEEFDLYYKSQSKYEFDARSGAPSEYDTRRLPFAVSIIEGWFPDKDGRILDIGCANGGLLGELKRAGYTNVQGADPSPACARTARQLYDVEVMNASMFDIPEDTGGYDLLILGSVLEHILDLNGAVQKLRALLRPNGRVYLEVPDMTRCSLLNDAPYQEFSAEHINYFGPVSLQNLWGKHGFELGGLRQTEIEQVPGLTVYEIKAIFALTHNAADHIVFDKETSEELRRYLSKSQGKLARIESVIDTLAQTREEIIVWGVGTHAQGLLATTRLKEANIVAFVDSNSRYTGQRLLDIPILPVEALRERKEPILVASQQFQDEIVDTIRNRMKLSNRVLTLYQTGGNPGAPDAKG